MKSGFTWLGCTGLLVLGCNTETSSTSTDPTTTHAEGSSGDAGAESSGTTLPSTTAETSTSDDSATEGSSSSGADTSTSEGESSSTGSTAMCGNGMVEGSEVCDGAELGAATCESEGFGTGTLACADDCTAFDTAGCAFCGNGIIEDGESCDGTLGGQSCVGQGFSSGALDCAADCTFDTTGCGTCGNDIIDGTEFCDGSNLAGADCIGLGVGFDSGTLSCAGNCTGLDTSTCGTCGNDFTDGDELCDGISLDGATCLTQGFDGGTLSCTADCATLVTTACTTCGDDVADVGETCDGADLQGETCASLGLTSGDLACTPQCGWDISGCDVPGLPFGSDAGYDGYVIQLDPALLPCDDISATGTPTGLTDDSQVEVPIGFTFPFYDIDFTNVTVESNGTLHFGGDVYLGYTNSCLPTATMPSDTNIYVFWDDLNPSTGVSEVYYQTLGVAGDQRFVVQWDTAHFGGDALDLIRMQAMLMESTQQIVVCYVDMLSASNTGDSGAEATAGVQLDSVTALGFSCDAPELVDGTELLYVPN